MMRSLIGAQVALTQVLNGEVFSLPVLATVEHEDLPAAAASLGAPLIVHPAAVVSVLHGLDQGVFPPELVQSWASFVRRGCIENPQAGPVLPLDIEYDGPWEGAVVEAVARMDELGDIIDGEISSHEVRILVQLFGDP